MNTIIPGIIKEPVDKRILPSIEKRPTTEPNVLKRASHALLSMQRSDGYWWFSLEANESIGAEFIFLMHFLEDVDEDIVRGICQRILDVQRNDGSWALYHDGPADLSTSIECYFALKLAGASPDEDYMRKARAFILMRGGVPSARVFTRIHLAMFGLIPWSACPEMPVEAIYLPTWAPLNIYEFSSWARATIVPLLVFMTLKPIGKLPESFTLDELYAKPRETVDWSYTTEKGPLSWDFFFITLDKALKLFEKIPFKPLRKRAINKCIRWTWQHISRTEDIYPALAYGALMFKTLGYSVDAPQIKKPLAALKRFQQCYATTQLPALPDELVEDADGRLSCSKPAINAAEIARGTIDRYTVHQQCCISPVWDTPWTLTALMEAGVANDAPAILRAARWLKQRQILECRGDWAVKNPKTEPGGWSFEFENDYFPDVDDAIQVLHVLERSALPHDEIRESIKRGYLWVLSMQNDDGGWAAFDKNNCRKLVNRIPFSDHGACLDDSSPDITGRAIELLALRNYKPQDKPVARALDYLWANQELPGCWHARWGVNYIYGTWCALSGLSRLGWNLADTRMRRAVGWLLATQHRDGGWGESPESYVKNEFVPWHESVPSQTAWGLMGLVAAGEAESAAAARAAQWLEERCTDEGTWEETAYTGTGFPGHFYIRYHGYRHYFPTLALARYHNARGR